jgi:hypothetical protein
MSIAVSGPPSGSPLPIDLQRRITVDEYHEMIRTGILAEDEPVELLEGWIVIKRARNPPHDLTLEKSDIAIRGQIPPGWRVRIQSALTTDDSEPEPDIAAVRGPIPTVARSHPRPSEVGMLAEVSESSLDHDRTVKLSAYASARIAVYWIINILQRQVEVYADPTGPAAQPTYRSRRDYGETDMVPLVLDGQEVARIPVRELLL